MTVKTCAKLFLLTNTLSFFALFLCLSNLLMESKSTGLLFDSIMCTVLGFLTSRYAAPDEYRDIGDTPVGNSPFISRTFAITLWIPIVLAAFAIASMLYFHANPASLTWIAISLAICVGNNLESLYNFYSYKK